MPYYGALRGQSLEITELPNGTVITRVVKTPIDESTSEEDIIDVTELEYPPLPTKYERNDSDDFSRNIKNIQNNAHKIVKLQEIAKEKGNLTENEKSLYKENMESLSKAAEELAKIQEQSYPIDLEGREALSAWFERKANNKKDKEDKKKKEDEDKRKKDEEDRKKKDEEVKRKKEEEERHRKEEEKKRKEQEERKRQEEEKKRKEEEERRKEEEKRKAEREEESDDEEDSVAVNLPPDDASVAEAKPVGLAVAGDGGVASSKPVGTAVVGPGGLAIARPIGTAIAGVSPDQALLPVYGINSGASKPTNNTNSDFLSRLIDKYHRTH
ncbi:unnamed protein product [Acanthoscelides obtectus]|uniref:DUF4774 domain-containing protein n=1 Tax=Acanthoscelides obtectus TaxID=200917 RepID=A0A9P0PCJ6_ACAOB|nr:unnamed protein product [Acanthoscelides obtectus]CAK1664491.1 hypothetical protein AOBTE_LOCUS24289 [Acanthoscelides obtectus]